MTRPFVMEAEDTAEDIQIAETFDGRVGLILLRADRAMHAPLNPDAARQIARSLLRAADDAERAFKEPESLN